MPRKPKSQEKQETPGGEQKGGEAKHCPGPSTRQILNQDQRPAPDLLAPSTIDTLGTADLPTDAYIDYGFHRREIDRVWRRCWQVACREDAIPKAGDYTVYDIVDDSVILVRQDDGGIRAFVNSCLHRGTRLCEEQGHMQQIRCPFHGFTWTLAGRFKEAPCAWDFPQIDPGDFGLPEVRVDTWGGFVFINFDDDGPSLAAYLENLPEHFQRWHMERRYTAAHVIKILDCNWKVALEAFLETYHVIGIHPESLPFFGDANSQFDVWPGGDHVSRMINPSGVPSPHLAARSTPQRVVDAAADFGLCAAGSLQPGETPRQRISAHIRETLSTTMGVDVSAYSDSEVLDVIQYSVFPNFMVFGGFGSPLAYRSRPAGDHPNRCVFEVWLLLPKPDQDDPPAPAPTRFLDQHERFSDAPELSYFGPVLDQDADMMPRVQKGLRTSRKGSVTLSRYQEIRIRHMRDTLSRYMQG